MSTSPATCPGSLENVFGPQVDPCRRPFDFTLLFEESILTILPLSIFLLLMPLRIQWLLKSPVRVERRVLHILKLIFFAVFCCLQLALLVLWSSKADLRPRTSIAAAVLGFLSSLISCFLSHLEHIHSVRPSALLNSYLLYSILVDFARTRTMWLLKADHEIAILYTVVAAWKVVLLISEETSKKEILKPEYAAYPPEVTSGVTSRALFLWINPLFMNGFKNLLSLSDLFVIDKSLGSGALLRQRQSATALPSTGKKTPGLFGVVVKDLLWPFLAVVPARLCLLGFTVAQPFLIARSVQWFSEPKNELSNNIGYGLIGAYGLVYVGIAISAARYEHLNYRFIVMVRGTLVSLIFNRTLDLSITAVSGSAPLTLMSTDVERITSGLFYLHESWANLIQIGVVMYLLERQLGAGCVAPILLSIICIGVTISFGASIGSAQKLWIQAIMKRVDVTTKSLGAMKSLKLSGLSGLMTKKIQQMRVHELIVSRGFRLLLIVNVALSYITLNFAPVVGFMIFALVARKHGDTLITAQAFASLSLFSLLSTPVDQFIQSLPSLASAFACFSTIQLFLAGESRNEYRKFPSTERHIHQSSSSVNSSDEVSEEKVAPTVEVQSVDSEEILSMENCSFRWKEDEEPVLQRISFVIKRSTLNLIIGPVGCGKSSMLNAILGEMPHANGNFRMSSDDIAYCSQSPWLTNGTLQENILGSGLFDRDWYATVVHACVLEQDLKTFDLGDQIQIGSKGLNISGGQKQRLALARAIYTKKSIMIFDDILSGLDSTTEQLLFQRLFSEQGLLRKLGITTVLATHAVRHLSAADKIIVLSSEGRVVEQGNFQELNANQGYVTSLNLGEPFQGLSKIDEIDAPTSIDFKLGATSNKEGELDGYAAVNRRTGDSRIYLYYVTSLGYVNTVFLLFFLSGFIFCVVFPSIWVKLWAAANEKTPNIHLGMYIGVYAALATSAIICLCIACYFLMVTMVTKSAEQLHWILLKTVMSAPLYFFSTTDLGVTINRFSQDMQLVDMELPMHALNSLATFLLCVGQFALLSLSTRFLAIAFPFCALIFYGIQNFYLRTSRQLRFLDLEAKSPLYTHFIEALSGLSTIRAFNWQKGFQSRSNTLLDLSQKPFYLLYCGQRWLNLVLNLVVAAIALLTMGVAYELRGNLSAGYVGVALLNVMTFSASLKAFISSWTQLEVSLGAVSRVQGFERETACENLPQEKGEVSAAWPEAGAIEFQQVSASYSDGGDLVLDGVNLSIKPREKIGICGRSGSGKSSIILALFRMIETSSGSIKVDSIDLSTIPRDLIRSRILAVPQDPFLFTGTTRYNADPEELQSDQAIITALRKVELWDVVQEKGGLDFEIEADSLSHGQQQLLCLARVLLRPGNIVVLDESTSSIDRATDNLIQKLIRTEFEDRTVIVVAHRLDNILDFDKVAVMSEGALVEFDSPEVLLRTPSAFKELYDSSLGEQAER